MMRHRYTSNVVLLLVLAQVAVLAWNCLRNRAEGQDNMAPMLAQVAWSECGLATCLWEATAIVETLRNRAEHRGQTLRQVTLAHSDYVFNRSRTDGRAWLAWLNPQGRKPRHWYSHLPWHGKHRRNWLRLVRHVSYVLERDVRVCAGKPITWGSTEDRVRYVRQNPRAVEVDCGSTRNHFMRPGPRRES